MHGRTRYASGGTFVDFLVAAIVIASILATLAPGVAVAQIDYRNLDDDRPTFLEDAYPIERYAFELLAPWRYSRARGGASVHAFIPELEYGMLPNFQLGLKLPVAGVSTVDGRDWGVSGLRLFGLYNFNTETSGLPAVSMRVDLTFPVGELAGDGTYVTLKGLATRSWGRNRVHLNAAYTFGPDGPLAAVEAASKWWAGVALDRTLYRESILVVTDLYARRDLSDEPVEVNTSVGLRYQWSPYTVLDAGVSRRLRSVGPDLEVTIGISRAFAIPGMIRERR